MRKVSTRCTIYIFGNHYYLLDKWATTETGWRDFPMPAQNDVWKFTDTLKMCEENKTRFMKDKQKTQSLLKKKIHCDIWNALFFTNVIDHWLKTLVCPKRKWAKLSFGTHIHSLQSSVFATRNKTNKKKSVAEARNWFIVVLVKA